MSQTAVENPESLILEIRGNRALEFLNRYKITKKLEHNSKFYRFISNIIEFTEIIEFIAIIEILEILEFIETPPTQIKTPEAAFMPFGSPDSSQSTGYCL